MNMRTSKESTGPIYRFEVTHPDYGELTVNHLSMDGAIMEAIRRWGADWKMTACDCTARKLGSADKPRCRRCGKEFGRRGDYAAYCPDCERANEQFRRERASRKNEDRRAGMRG